MRRLAVIIALAGTTAFAHLMPAQQGTLNVLDDAVFEVVALPVSALPWVDDDGDGRASGAEIIAHEAQLQQHVGKHYLLFDGAQQGQLELVVVRAEVDERSELSLAGAKQLLVLLKTRFAREPRALRLETDLFGEDAESRQLTIKATRRQEVDVAVLTPLRPAHAFFRAPLRVLGDAVLLGAEHILLGPDHLVFLLAVLVAVAGWRAWLGVLTTFTVAHSLTLVASVLGWVSLPSRIVEPLIAASIVGVAVLNLVRPEARHRLSLVFACGLVHGLGFASAVGDLGLKGLSPVMSVLGFNVGVELGQLCFALPVLALLAFARRLATTQHFEPGLRLMQVASVLSVLVGSVWLVQRLSG